MSEYKFDVQKECEHIVNWIKNFFEENGKGCKAVLGISGGKDSSVCAALCVKALGKENVFGVLMPDNVQTVTSIYNSKITSIDTHDFTVSSLRINVLDENIEEINEIIEHVKSGEKLQGTEYTNGNMNREI